MDKLKESYAIRERIITNYMNFITSSIYKDSMFMRRTIISEIKRLLNEEYKLIKTMNIDEIDTYLASDYFETDDLDSSTLSILKNKLIDRKQIILGKCINGQELGVNNLNENFEFSIYDAILSMISIEVIKKLENKIYGLNVNCKSDAMFVSSLKQELNMAKISLIFSLSTSEMIAIYNDIDNIPEIEFSKIKEKISTLGMEDMDNAIISTVVVYAKGIIDKITLMYNMTNNPSDVFLYLLFITRLEVLLTYMNLEVLRSVYNYCLRVTNENNVNVMNNTRKLVKKELNNYN